MRTVKKEKPRSRPFADAEEARGHNAVELSSAPADGGDFAADREGRDQPGPSAVSHFWLRNNRAGLFFLLASPHDEYRDQHDGQN